jgi:8-oxo-dGTP diphosphatase
MPSGGRCKEETGLDLDDLHQFHVYSDPERDPRGHTVSVVFAARGVGTPIAGDDAGRYRLVSLDSASDREMVFDHAQILRDFVARGATL